MSSCGRNILPYYVYRGEKGHGPDCRDAEAAVVYAVRLYSKVSFNVHISSGLCVSSSEKKLFEQMKNAQIQVTLRIKTVSSVFLRSFGAVYNIKCLCERTAKALIGLRGCAVRSGPSMSTNASKPPFRMALSCYCMT